MKVFEIEPELIILKGTKEAEPKYRKEISSLIIEKFGRGPFSTEVTTQILYFCQSYYISQFEKRIGAERSYTFFKEVFIMNEMAANLRRSSHFNSLPEGLDKAYIAGYRRILKMILESGCDINMVTGEKRDPLFINRIKPLMNDLLYLGQMIGSFTESSAEQKMVEDISDISFDENDLYNQARKPYYENVFERIVEDMEAMPDDFVIDLKGQADYNVAVEKSFGFNAGKIQEVLAILHHNFQLELPCCLSADRDGFIRDSATHAGVAVEIMEEYLAGLALHRGNKMSLSELVRHPHSIHRFLYRPILIWNINGKDFCVCGIYSFDEAENSLLLNAIPWGKFPKEWSHLKDFTKYVNEKKEQHDKWLDDEVEKIIKKAGLLYERGVKKIHTKEKSFSITGKGLGEIDFLIICPATKTLMVTECKHLLGRYDMVNWKHDYDHFTVDGKDLSYNNRLTNKLIWIKENARFVQEHFQRKFNDTSIDILDYKVEGAFVINTPTFYMHNAVHRIYTYHRFDDVLTGHHQDKIFPIPIETDDEVILYKIGYPYFQKPNLYYFHSGDEDADVDKYGDPIEG
jgi:hypothetical protein